MSTHLARLVEERVIIVCCGTGGVGKTTVAAVLAVEGARRGRNAVVVTIDPAKRLANTLGLDTLSNAPHEIDRERWDLDGSARAGAGEGRLSAMMLDTKSTFDGLVTRYSADPEQAERILENRFYRSISSALSGTQEYMAMEKLYELHEEGGYELIVIDTPPTRHALDFLDAPRRLTRLLDNRIFKLLMMPTRASMRLAGRAVQAFLRTVSKVVGGEAINDVVAFFRAFEGMEEGFRDRAARVLELLAAGTTGFVLVTSPRRDAVDEALFFADKLAEGDMPVDALVVNRVHPRFGEERPEGLRARASTLAHTDGAAAGELAALYTNLADFQEVSDRERHQFDDVRTLVDQGAAAYVPFLARDVHDFDALAEVGHHMFAADEAAAAAREQRPIPMKILVVADARWVREQVRAAFVGPGQEVVEVTSGQEVREAVAGEKPDLVVLDLQVGNMGGIAVAIDLRLEESAGRLPRSTILLLLDREADHFLAKRADVDLALVKPVDAGILRRAAKRLLETRDAAPA